MPPSALLGEGVGEWDEPDRVATAQVSGLPILDHSIYFKPGEMGET
jgi:hypothetical protein